MLLPLSGAQSTYAADCRLSAEIAVEQINADGGIAGRKLEVVFQDDKANPNAAIAAAKGGLPAGARPLPRLGPPVSDPV